MVVCGLMLQLASPREAAACLIRVPPWRTNAVWPRPDVRVPLNVRIQVRIPEGELWQPPPEPLRITTRRGSMLPERLDQPPIPYERALSLFAVAEGGTLGDEVATDRRILEPGGAWRFELSPRALLRPESTYVVVWQNAKGERERIGEIHTAKQADRTPPSWDGIQAARFAPPYLGDNRLSYHDCFTNNGAHGPRAIVQVHPPRDEEQPVQFLIWVQKAASRIDYTIAPRPPLFAQQGVLMIDDFPWQAGRVRVGIRALDAVGNLSPPSEIDVEIKHGPCDASERGCP